jgi:hypothetical protein
MTTETDFEDEVFEEAKDSYEKLTGSTIFNSLAQRRQFERFLIKTSSQKTAQAKDDDMCFKINSKSDTLYHKTCSQHEKTVNQYCIKCLIEKEQKVAQEIFAELDKILYMQSHKKKLDAFCVHSEFICCEEYQALKLKYLKVK